MSLQSGVSQSGQAGTRRLALGIGYPAVFADPQRCGTGWVYTGTTWDALNQLAAVREDKARANPLVYEVMETQSGMALDPSCVIAPPAVEVGDRTRHLIAMRLLPFLFVLYIANYLDRTNLAYAALGLGDAGAPRKPEVGKIGGWQPVSGLPTNCPQFVSATSPIKAGLRQAA